MIVFVFCFDFVKLKFEMFLRSKKGHYDILIIDIMRFGNEIAKEKQNGIECMKECLFK